MNLLNKQGEEIAAKNKKKKPLQKACIIFSMQEKRFLMALKANYF